MTDPAIPQEAPEIPDKLYFRIGEVAGLLAVEPYVLRYWETEFPSLAPKKSGTGHRLYRRKDVELLLKIKHLLYDMRYTIEGARQSLQNEAKINKVRVAEQQRELFNPLAGIRTELASILKILK
ncbi:MAG TPA: MerR family transcriptional regulator [Bryobacteraceae bacterium]|nr:MerR family transcriptional regulator [Bryobacteraceae bacterium]